MFFYGGLGDFLLASKNCFSPSRFGGDRDGDGDGDGGCSGTRHPSSNGR